MSIYQGAFDTTVTIQLSLDLTKKLEDNNVPVGYVQVALLDYYKVRIYKDITLAFGWENDDFTKNLVTSICEMKLHQYFSENHTGAFIYDTFANIETAITTV